MCNEHIVQAQVFKFIHLNVHDTKEGDRLHVCHARAKGAPSHMQAKYLQPDSVYRKDSQSNCMARTHFNLLTPQLVISIVR